METTIIAWGCLLLGLYRFYELNQKKDTFTKTEKYARIGIGVFMIAIGSFLLARIYLIKA